MTETDDREEGEIRRRRRRRRQPVAVAVAKSPIYAGQKHGSLYTCDTYAGKAMGKVYEERGRVARRARGPPPDLRSRAKSVGGERGGARSTLSQYTVSPRNTERGIAGMRCIRI